MPYNILSIEKVSEKGIRAQHDRVFRVRRYYKILHDELLEQRSLKGKEIQEALLEKAVRNYSFKNWYRAVRYEFSLHPLSSFGSLQLSGRFNCGRDMHPSIERFPGLYVAENAKTALAEALGQDILSKKPKVGKVQLDHYDLALTKPQSEAIVLVESKLDNIFELDDCRKLTKFVNILKTFKASDFLKREAKRLGIHGPMLISKPRALYDSILHHNWRADVSDLMIPSNSQVFASILVSAGINGVKYPSKHTGENCIAIFPDSFSSSLCQVAVQGDYPPTIAASSLDANNYKVSSMTYEEVINLKSSLQ